VWLLSSHDIPNLKVEGSSPSFGYSYETKLTFFLSFPHHLELVEEAKSFLRGEAWGLADRVGNGEGCGCMP
jgi:hypothetical protein